jgi:hypothetical protein
VGIAALAISKGCGKGWETVQLDRPVFHPFHQTVISTAVFLANPEKSSQAVCLTGLGVWLSFADFTGIFGT